MLTSDPFASPVSWAFGTFWFWLPLQWPALCGLQSVAIWNNQKVLCLIISLYTSHFSRLALGFPVDIVAVRLAQYLVCTTPRSRWTSLPEGERLTSEKQDTMNKVLCLFSHRDSLLRCCHSDTCKRLPREMSKDFSDFSLPDLYSLNRK